MPGTPSPGATRVPNTDPRVWVHSVPLGHVLWGESQISFCEEKDLKDLGEAEEFEYLEAPQFIPTRLDVQYLV